MRLFITAIIFACFVFPARVSARTAALIMNGTNPPRAEDQSVIDRLELEFGLETVLIDHTVAGPTKNTILDSVKPDLIIILESTNSGDVANQLNEREEPILVQEAFLVDDMGFVAGAAGCTDCWGDLGNDFGNQANETDLDIVNDEHPIIKAAGLSGAGTIPVYESPGRIQWYHNLIEDAEVLAVATNGFDEDGDGESDAAAAFVVEPGAELVDGSELAGLRLVLWIHTEGGAVTNATPQGLGLWDAMVDYALESFEPPPVDCEDEECPGKAVVILADPVNPSAGDQAILARIEEEFGMRTVLVDDNEPENVKIDIIEAERPAVIFVFESVGSGNVGQQLNDRPEPVILHEPFLYDDMGLVVGTAGCDECWGDLGNDFGNISGESDLDVVGHDHPIIREAGLQDADTFATYDPPGRLLWGRNFIDDAEVLVVATNGHDEDGDGLSDDVTLVVVEPGAELVDGSENAGLRIGGWIHAAGDNFLLLTEEGLALWDACVLYALGKIDSGPPETRFVRGDSDSDGSVSLTDGIATLAWLFQGSDEPPCLDAADTSDDGKVIINDAVLIFGWLFAGGSAPAAPTPTLADYPPGDCGVDESEDELGCATPSPKCAG